MNDSSEIEKINLNANITPPISQTSQILPIENNKSKKHTIIYLIIGLFTSLLLAIVSFVLIDPDTRNMCLFTDEFCESLIMALFNQFLIYINLIYIILVVFGSIYAKIKTYDKLWYFSMGSLFVYIPIVILVIGQLFN